MRRVVTLHYTLRDPAGQLLDSSIGGEPIRYLEGAGAIIEGLDEAVSALAAGAKSRISVPAARAYGERDPSQVQKVPRSVLPVDGELRHGDQFRAGEDAYAPVVTVVSIEGEDVLLDANHPLAGVDLDFEVEVVSARPATAEELSHGHAHADDGRCG